MDQGLGSSACLFALNLYVGVIQVISILEMARWFDDGDSFCRVCLKTARLD
jgi:hypothetical protein